MDRKTRALCSEEVPGDTQRNLDVASTFSGQTFKHILVPIWIELLLLSEVKLYLIASSSLALSSNNSCKSEE